MNEGKQEARLKAYAVTEHDECTGGIIFAKHAIVARRIGASEYGSGEITSVACRRAKWADFWAERKEDVPAAVCIANGWHFECSWCGSRIDEDYLDERRLPLAGVSGTQSSLVFCCSAHERAHLRDVAAHKRAKAKAISILQSMVRKRFPGATFETGDLRQHAYCPKNGSYRVTQQVIVSFAFPGMKYGPATLRYDTGTLPWKQQGPVRPEFMCCAGDQEAFENFARATQDAADTTAHVAGTEVGRG